MGKRGSTRVQNVLFCMSNRTTVPYLFQLCSLGKHLGRWRVCSSWVWGDGCLVFLGGVGATSSAAPSECPRVGAGGADLQLPGVLQVPVGRAAVHRRRRARTRLPGRHDHRAVRPAGRSLRVSQASEKHAGHNLTSCPLLTRRASGTARGSRLKGLRRRWQKGRSRPFRLLASPP
jgi:hypothetical protein